jgi:spermidine dehydrogenase
MGNERRGTGRVEGASMTKRDPGCGREDLGESRPIARRDFLQGTLVGAATVLGGALLRPLAAAEGAAGAAQDQPGYYPPLLNGMRGSQPGSFEAAHALRDGGGVGAAVDCGESYDLIVVGAGISGLAAAHFFRARTSPKSRVLLLDNHDDFGGHARRNEFNTGGALQLMNGGTLEIDSPRPYSATASGLLRTLGIDLEHLPHIENRAFYEHAGLREAAFFDAETFGADRLLVGLGRQRMQQLLAQAPLSARAREDFIRLYEGDAPDVFPGIAAGEKKLRLARISYRDYLQNLLHLDPAVVAYCQALTHEWWAVGSDAVSALDAWGMDYPGFEGLKLPHGSIPQMGNTPAGYQDTGGSRKLHFPDGNATIARALVRQLIPAAVPGAGLADLITRRIDYGRLDRSGSPVRLRLNSTVVRVRHAGDPQAARTVEVTYLRDGRLCTVRAAGCVLACWNMMIPYLCPELPPAQQAALHSLVKAPLVYTSVAVRNWRAFQKLGIYSVYAPGSYHTSIRLNAKVEIGSYRSPANPDEPMLVHMVRTPCKPGLSEYEQNKAGRAELLATSFATFERNIREQLLRTLGPGGFDPVHDIQAITVNRWPHGYAPEYNSLYDPDLPEARRPHVIGRERFGRITIANSDAGAAAYTDSAIDQASRAVNELLQA